MNIIVSISLCTIQYQLKLVKYIAHIHEVTLRAGLHYGGEVHRS